MGTDLFIAVMVGVSAFALITNLVSSSYDALSPFSRWLGFQIPTIAAVVAINLLFWYNQDWGVRALLAIAGATYVLWRVRQFRRNVQHDMLAL